MIFIRSLVVGAATAIVLWLGHIGVGLAAMPAGPDFRFGYIIGCGGALLSAVSSAGRGLLRSVGAAVLFYLPVAWMCVHLARVWAPYPHSGKAQWDSILLWITIVTFSAAIVASFLPPIRFSQNDDA